MNPKALWAALALALPFGASAQTDPCAAFSWNIAHERALFAAPATPLAAGTNSANAPLVKPDHLEELQLRSREQVSFALPPGKTHPNDGNYAGLARLRVTAAGVYRIALDQAAWIDVVVHGRMVASGDYQGQPGCHAPHKIVQFALPADQDLLLQFSGNADAHLRLTVTRADDASR